MSATEKTIYVFASSSDDNIFHILKDGRLSSKNYSDFLVSYIRMCQGKRHVVSEMPPDSDIPNIRPLTTEENEKLYDDSWLDIMADGLA